MAEVSVKEDWVWTLTERPPDRNEDESRYIPAVGETRFTLLEFTVAVDAGHSFGFLPTDEFTCQIMQQCLQSMVGGLLVRNY